MLKDRERNRGIEMRKESELVGERGKEEGFCRKGRDDTHHIVHAASYNECMV